MAADNLLTRAQRLHGAGQLDEAAQLYRQYMKAHPKNAEAPLLLGTIFIQKGDPAEGVKLIDRSLRLNPQQPNALINRGVALYRLGRFNEALETADRVIALTPDFAPAYLNRANALRMLGRPAEAVASYDRALALDSNFIVAYANRGDALRALARPREAIASYDRALALDPNLAYTPGNRLLSKLELCDWSDYDGDIDNILSRAGRGENAAVPHVLALIPSTPQQQLALAAAHMRDMHNVSPAAHPRVHAHDKIRIAYFSADFREHATAALIAELIARHDRTKFEVFGFSFRAEGDSPMYARLSRAFDRMIAIDAMSDEEAAALARRMEIDIAIDLAGYTQGNRTSIFARRAAPIQVNFLGFPGTMGADFIDYIIADPIVIPDAHREFYAERVVHLPDTYQPNDAGRAEGGLTFSRAQLGLPEDAFVFCSFNANTKIGPNVFNLWMRILKQVDHSVLWLLEGNADSVAALRWAAMGRGVNAERLIFAPRMALTDHLARQAQADLFLDTFPCSAHTTASDAMLAGLPLITRLGDTFAGRVAASVLHAIGLSELVVQDEAAYERVALALAADKNRLEAIRRTLRANRATHPLFDTARYTRSLEAAFSAMQARSLAGLRPDHIRIEPPG